MIFSLRQFQEKCKEQQKPLYIAFIDLTKAFDLVSRDGLFNILLKIGCPPNLHRSFHDDMKATVQYRGQHVRTSQHQERCEARLCPCPDTIWHLLLPPSQTCLWDLDRRSVHAYKIRWQAVQYRKTQSKDQDRKTIIRDMLFADDAALTANTEHDLPATDGPILPC